MIGLIVVAGVWFAAAVASAQSFPAPAEAWTKAGPGSATVTDITYGVRLSYDLNDTSAWGGQTWTYSATAAETGQLYYRWTYAGFHAWYQASAKATAFVERNGVRVAAADLFNQTVSGDFGGNGLSGFDLVAGDKYGFELYGRNFDSTSILRGALEIRTSPRIEPSLTGTLGNADWYRSDVALSWTLADPAGGAIDASGCEPVTVTTDTTVTGATYTCTAASLGGTASHAVTVKRDTVAPVTTDNAPADASDLDVVVDLSAGDEGSGVAATHYRVNGGAQQTGTSVVFATYGIHTLTYWSVDVAGNIEPERSATIRIKLADATFVPDVTGPTNQDVTLAVAFPAYAASKEVSSDGIVWSPYTAPIVATVNQSVYARYVHEDGGWSHTSRYDIENIDKAAPTTTSETTVDAATSFVTVTFHAAADGGSGIAGTYYKVDGNPAQVGDSVQLRAQGAHTVRYWSIDEAGNIEQERLLAIEVQRLPIPADGRLHIGLLLPWIKNSASERLDVNDDGAFDRLDLVVMLRAIGPVELLPDSTE